MVGIIKYRLHVTLWWTLTYGTLTVDNGLFGVLCPSLQVTADVGVESGKDLSAR